GLEVEPIGVGAVPAEVFPMILLLVKDCVAPLIPVPLKEMSLLDRRMVTVPPAFCTPMPLLLLTLLLTFNSVAARAPLATIPALVFPENTERLIITRPLLPIPIPKEAFWTRTFSNVASIL